MRGAILSVECNNPMCKVSIEVTLQIGASIPGLPNVCSKCNSGILLLRSLNSSKDHSSSKTEDRRALQLVNQPSIINGQDNRVRYQNNSPGGAKILTAFYNRYATGLILMEICRDLAREGNKEGEVLVSEIIVEFLKRSEQIKNHLRSIEDENRISRGERLSDGFPTSNPKNPILHNDLGSFGGAAIIAMKSWLGCNGEELIKGSGILMEIGILERKDAHTIIVTEVERTLEEFPLYEHLMSLKKPITMYGESRPYLGCFYTESMAELLIKKTRSMLYDEYEHMMYILNLVGESEIESGWNSNFYAIEETELILHGAGHPRWGNRYQLYLERANRSKRDRIPDEYAYKSMVNNINSTLGGLLGRMKELGLIHPIKSGSVKNVRITPFGANILEDYRKGDVL